MDSFLLWQLFLDTGMPEVYLLYRKSSKEAEPVSA